MVYLVSFEEVLKVISRKKPLHTYKVDKMLNVEIGARTSTRLQRIPKNDLINFSTLVSCVSLS